MTFDAVDTDRDGKIDYAQFCAMLNPRLFLRPVYAPLTARRAAGMRTSALHWLISSGARSLRRAVRVAVNPRAPRRSDLLGEVSRDKLSRALRAAQVPLPDAEMEQVLDACDPARLGKVRYKDVMSSCSNPHDGGAGGNLSMQDVHHQTEQWMKRALNGDAPDLP